MFDFHGFDSPPTLQSEDELEYFGLVNHGLRWTDFNMHADGIENSPRRGDIFGVQATNDYLAKSGISGIVRGHQDLYHLSLLPKIIHNDSTLSEVVGYGMHSPNRRYPAETLKSGFERLPFPHAFENFSVFTTSTAVRARKGVGFYTYLELKTNKQAIRDAQSRLSLLTERHLNGELNAKEVHHLKTFSEGERAFTVNFQRVVDIYRTIKGDTKYYKDLFPIFELLSYDPFTHVRKKRRSWRGWLPRAN